MAYDYVGQNLNMVSEMPAEKMRGMTEWIRPTMSGIRDAIFEHRVIHIADNDLGKDRESKRFAAVHDAMYEAITIGRAFDVGYLPNEVIKSESKRAGVLYGNKHIGHPFRQSYILFHTWEGGGAVYLCQPHKSIHNEFAAMEFICITLGEKNFLMMSDSGLVTCDPVTGFNGTYHPSHVRIMAMQDPTSPAHDIPPEEALCNVVDPIVACMLLLATDGVAVNKIAASDKLNKARIKNRKLPIPPYWQVDTKPYVTAITTPHRRAEGEEHGTHRTPVPHLRRGHLRNLHERHGGGVTWVRDALVNIKDPNSPLARSFYHIQQEGEKPK